MNSNKKHITICPYCLNKSVIHLEQKEGIIKYICPICKRGYNIEIENDIKLHSIADKREMMITIGCEEEINIIYNKKNKSRIYRKTNSD